MLSEIIFLDKNKDKILNTKAVRKTFESFLKYFLSQNI
jgi:hypothetical protein